MRHLALEQTLGNHPNRSPASPDDGIGHLAHHADMSAAKNKGPATLCQGHPHGSGEG